MSKNIMLVKEVMDGFQLPGIGYVGIDRVVIGIPFEYVPPSPCYWVGQPSAEDDGYAKWKAQAGALKYVEYALMNFFKVNVQKIKGVHLRRFRVFSDDSNRLLMVVMLGKTPKGLPVLNFEFNPSRLSQDDWAEVDAGLSLLLDGHYDELYETGVVSHFEFFIETDQHAIGDLVLIDLGRRKRTMHMATTYSGRRAGKLVGTMYDKAAQLGQPGNRVRIEARINRRDLTFRSLVDGGLDNPFATFLVVPAQALSTIAKEWDQHPHLAHQLREFGLYEAAKNVYARKKIASRLSELAVPWWEPKAYWEVLSQMLEEFRPASLHGCAPQVASGCEVAGE